MIELEFKYDRFDISVYRFNNYVSLNVYNCCGKTMLFSLAHPLLLSFYPYRIIFLSFLLMEYVLCKVNKLVFDRQLTGVKS